MIHIDFKALLIFQQQLQTAVVNEDTKQARQAVNVF